MPVRETHKWCLNFFVLDSGRVLVGPRHLFMLRHVDLYNVFHNAAMPRHLWVATPRFVKLYLALVLGPCVGIHLYLDKLASCGYWTGQSISNYYIASVFLQNGAKSGFEMCFGPSTDQIWRHFVNLGCWGQNTSRIQNKEVYATLYLQACCSCTSNLKLSHRSTAKN